VLVQSDPQDGHGFQNEFCGCDLTVVDPKLKQRVRNFREGIQRVKECQCLYNHWNPRRPRTPLAQCLFQKVKSRLKTGDDLRLFIAINTALDYWMGVDCFFECNGRIVTVDLSVSSYKRYYKADILLTRQDFVKNHHYKKGDIIARKLSQKRR